MLVIPDDPAPATTKDELRARLQEARRARSAAELAGVRAQVRARVLRLVDSHGSGCVAAYEPLRTEPGSVELLAALTSRGVRVLVPHTLPDRDLDWREWTANGGAPLLGKDAVHDADLVLVPALAAARNGTRLGRGRGCYDRALVRRRAGAQVWALLFDGEVLDAVPRETWDVPVDGIVLPSGILTTARNTGSGSAG